jgi:hypothetical protein
MRQTIVQMGFRIFCPGVSIKGTCKVQFLKPIASLLAR